MINFRRIYFSNAQVIPKNKPVIIAANHPSAFLEPCILAVLLPRPLHFLVRGDFFKKPFFSKILQSLHMLPIFRMKDGGFKNIKNNFSTFEKCFSTLAEGKVIMILAEGTTVHEKRLRPLRKGTARLALGTLEKYPDLDLQVIPVGVNYTDSDRFRSHAMIEFGQPIAAKDYVELFKKDPNQAIKKMTDDVRADLEKHIVIIDAKEDEALTEKILDINRNSRPEPNQPVVSKLNYLLKSEIRISKSINEMEETDKKVLEIKVDEYLDTLKKNGLGDYAIAVGNIPGVKSWLIIILGAFPFLLGLIGNFLPVKLVDLFITKKIKAIEFRTSVKVTATIFAYVFYLLLLLIILLVNGNYTLLFVLLALPFFGYYGLLYYEYFQKWIKLRKLKTVDSSDLINLQEIRNSILSGFNLEDK